MYSLWQGLIDFFNELKCFCFHQDHWYFEGFNRRTGKAQSRCHICGRYWDTEEGDE